MPKKTFTGEIVSNKMQKTVVVEIERRVKHPTYGKILKRLTRLKADTNNIDVSVGQMVKIEQTKPLSRDKHFKVVEVVTKGEK